MNNHGLPIAIVAEEQSRDLTVLRITSAAKNNVIQPFPERVQVSFVAIRNLHRNIVDKLRLHGINNIQVDASIQFQNDRMVTFSSLEAFEQYDLKIELCTYLVIIKWSFIFRINGDEREHLHSIFVRVCELPNPGLLIQKVFSNRNEDIASLDSDAFAPVTCKLDFIDSRFSEELISVVDKWVLALPKPEPTFGVVNWLYRHEDSIQSFIRGTLPAVAVLGYIGIWLGLLPTETSGSVRNAVAWVLGGGGIFLFSQYVTSALNDFFKRQIRRIRNVPIFDITSGDSNKITAWLAKSHASVFKLAGAGLVYGVFKVVGLYLASYVASAIL